MSTNPSWRTSSSDTNPSWRTSGDDVNVSIASDGETTEEEIRTIIAIAAVFFLIFILILFSLIWPPIGLP